MLENVLGNRIRMEKSVKDWKEAIRIASTSLVEENLVQETYVEAMIENVEKFGSYIVVAPKVAMPHARPEGRVAQNCLSFLQLEEAVYFEEGNEEAKAYLIFVLGAKDSNSHIETLMQLMEIIDDEEKVESLMRAKTAEELKTLL